MKNPPQSYLRAQEILESLFRSIEGVSITSQERPDRSSGLCLSLDVHGTHRKVLVEAKNTGHPGQAKLAVGQLKDNLHKPEYQGAYPLFVAPSISEESARICREADIGFLDYAGNGSIHIPGLIYHVEGKRNPHTRSRGLKSLFSPRASAISRVMLANRIKPWKVTDLSNESGASLGLVSNVRKLLLEQELAEEMEEGIRLTDPETLLNLWRENAQQHLDKRTHGYFLEDIPNAENRIESHFKMHNIEYGFTGGAAAARFAPFVIYTGLEVYGSHFDLLIDLMDLQPVEMGWNLTMVEPADKGVYYGMKRIGNLQIVHPVQAYIDLQGEAGRKTEAASFLLREAIKPIWYPDAHKE